MLLVIVLLLAQEASLRGRSMTVLIAGDLLFVVSCRLYIRGVICRHFTGYDALKRTHLLCGGAIDIEACVATA